MLTLAEVQAICRSRKASSREFEHRREEGARRLDDVQYAVDARPGALGPEAVHRGRTALAAGLSGDEAARGPDSCGTQGPPDRSAGATGAVLRRLGQAGGGGEVADGVRGPQEERRKNREAGRAVSVRYFV